jgi:hypothetical protein
MKGSSASGPTSTATSSASSTPIPMPAPTSAPTPADAEAPVDMDALPGVDDLVGAITETADAVLIGIDIVASQMLSTASSAGLSNPYATDSGDVSSNGNPGTNDSQPGALSSFVGKDVDPFINVASWGSNGNQVLVQGGSAEGQPPVNLQDGPNYNVFQIAPPAAAPQAVAADQSSSAESTASPTDSASGSDTDTFDLTEEEWGILLDLFARDDAPQAPSMDASPPAVPASPVTPAQPDWTTQVDPYWTYPAPDHRLIQPVTRSDTGNRVLNVLVNKVLMPWRNALAFYENIPLAVLVGIDETLDNSPFQMEYRDLQMMNPEGGLTLFPEIGASLDYTSSWLSTNPSLRALITAPADGFVGTGGLGNNPVGDLPALGPEIGNAVPGPANAVPTGPSFEGTIDVKDFEDDPAIIDRLTRARELDIGGYHSLTGPGKFGRVGDGLDSDEALQNAYIRTTKNVGRVSDITRNNPAIALRPELHSLIKNLRTAQMRGLSPEDMLQFHLQQMREFVPDYILSTLEREAARYINVIF